MSREARVLVARKMSERELVRELMEIERILETCKAVDAGRYLEGRNIAHSELTRRTIVKTARARNEKGKQQWQQN